MSAVPRRLPLLLAFLILAVMLVTIIAVVATRPAAIDPLDPPAPTPTPPPTDWMTPGRSVRHVVVIPVSLNKIPVHQISLPALQSPDLVKPTADGGCLALSSAALATSPTRTPTSAATTTASGSTLVTVAPTGAAPKPVVLRATRFTADGAVLWDRQYDTERDDGFLMSCCVFSDGSFAVGMQVHADPVNQGKPTLPTLPGALPRIEARLLRFAAEGTLLWTAESSLTPVGSLERLFALADGSILSAGTIEGTQDGQSGQAGTAGTAGGTGTGQSHNQVSVQHFDISGKRLGQRFLSLPVVSDAATGRTANGSVSAVASAAVDQLQLDASWSEGAGLVIAWRYFADGPGIGSAASQAACLTALSADLKDKWSIQLPSGTMINSIVALPDTFGILATGTAISAATDPTSRSTLFHFTGQGSSDWQYAASSSGSWLLEAARLSDGQYIVGQYRVKEDGSEATALQHLSANGTLEETLIEVPGRVDQIVPASDGGFTCVLRQTVRALPQPPYISSLWQDTEAIVCQFSRRLQLSWRRTIDQYKYQMRNDLIVITSRDRLLVG